MLDPYWGELALDCLFLEIKQIFEDGRYGSLRGASFHVTFASPVREEGWILFLGDLLGPPDRVLRERSGSVAQIVGLHGDRFAVQCTLVELAAPLPYMSLPISIHGSLSFSRALLDLRWGSERTMSVLDESGTVRAVWPAAEQGSGPR